MHVVAPLGPQYACLRHIVWYGVNSRQHRSCFCLFSCFFCAVNLCTRLRSDSTAFCFQQQQQQQQKKPWFDPVRLHPDLGFYSGNHPKGRYFFVSLIFFCGGKERGKETRMKYMGEGPATQDYRLVIGNVCKAIHALQLHWSTQKHWHLQMHQSGNTRSTDLHEMCIDCTWGCDYFPKC